MEILEVPFPALVKGNVLVRNYYSVISAGTERKSVKDAKASYIGKSRSRPNEVKHVFNAVKSQGLVTTYRLVMNRLNVPSSLGYSCAGEVINVGYEVFGIQIGDFVACGGGSANHSEVVSVPRNLCVKVPDGVSFKHAAFTTIGSIAIQSIRQADLRLGENCVVIGLGLIGLLTVQLLNAAGIKAIGVDIDNRQIELARKSDVYMALERHQPALKKIIMDQTNGFGTDAVIITAGTSSLDPVELAGELCRKKGKVVVVGAVPTGFSRDNYYKKELELRMSCSYGPGRYDPQYEEKGIDYPYAYVRWTENRNMQAFLSLLKNKKINLDSLITRTFDFEDSPNAYKMILEKSKPYTGIVLKYDVDKELKKIVRIDNKKNIPSDNINIGLIGAGSFAQNILLPALQKASLGSLFGLAEARPNMSQFIAEKYKFKYVTGDSWDIINDDEINTIFMATRHNSHAKLVLNALKRDKNIFIEKPLCMKLEELEEIKKEYEKRNIHLMVGFNRRFSPYTQKIKEKFSAAVPVAINYRINAGVLQPDHWIHDKDIGGGRIIGEVCHFIDLAMYLAGAPIQSVFACVMDSPKNLHDTLVINLGFSNGSIASISYFSNGNRKVSKELLEVFSAGQVAVIDDFKKMTIYNNKSSIKMKLKPDKGHNQEVAMYLEAIKNGLQTPIPFNEIYLSTYMTFKVVESIKTNNSISI